MERAGKISATRIERQIRTCGDGKYCHDTCPAMEIGETVSCRYFEKDLDITTKNGIPRLSECIDHETA